LSNRRTAHFSIRSRSYQQALAAGLALGITAFPLSVAHADAPPAPKAAADPQGGAEDEVTLKNGGMLRGTVVVFEPQKRVVILIQGTSEQRTVPWTEVDKVERGKYPAAKPAPPEEKKPKARRSSDDDDEEEEAAPVKRRRAPQRGSSPVSLVSDQPDITFHLRTGGAQGVVVGGGWSAVVQSESFRDLCTAPCSVDLDHRSYRFALSSGGGKVVQSDEPVLIRGPATVTGSLDSYQGTRIAGWLIFGLGTAAGAGMMLAAPFAGGCEMTSFGICTKRNYGPTVPLLIAGGAVMLASLITGFILVRKRDEAHISVSPGVSGASAPRASDEEALSLQALKGLTVTAAF